MPTSSTGYDQDELPPPGTRWGAGARSVLPYLTRSLQAKPATGPDARDAKARDPQQPGRERERDERPSASAA